MQKTAFRRVSCFLLAALMLAVAAPVRADDDDDAREQEMARQALQQGLIRPLSEITAALGAQVPGDVISVKLETEEGMFVYEFKVLTPEGVLKEVEVDARTAKVIKVEDDD
jgi:uncharacterized membrane protein YkoI